MKGDGSRKSISHSPNSISISSSTCLVKVLVIAAVAAVESTWYMFE